MKYFLIAGEASGDLHGASLIRSLLAADPGARVRFWGGDCMRQAALEADSGEGDGLLRDYAEGAEMGFSNVLLHAGKHLGRLRDAIADITAFHPDAVILIDYPGFNLRVARAAHKAGYKVFYYIAPKVWASRERRLAQLKKYVDMLFVIFPFEQEYFASKGVPYIYEGNPLVDELAGRANGSAPDASPAAAPATGIEAASQGRIALLPGSRKAEISSMMPVMMEYADRMHSMDEFARWTFTVAGAPGTSWEDFAGYISGRESWMQVCWDDTPGVLRSSSLAVINSGTASLQACLTLTPQMVCYSMSRLNYAIARRIVRVKYISLGNLILDRQAFKEFIQKDFTADNLLAESLHILRHPGYRAAMLDSCTRIRTLLGPAGSSDRLARHIIRLSRQ